MATDPLNEMERKFPWEEEFIDHSSCSRQFRISLHKQATGAFFLYARDLSQVDGYRFEVYRTVYSFQEMCAALGDLRRKIRKGIVTRYLCTDASGEKNLTHDEIHGRISSKGLVVNGELLSFEDLERILTTNEGFEISIRIASPAE